MALHSIERLRLNIYNKKFLISDRTNTLAGKSSIISLHNSFNYFEKQFQLEKIDVRVSIVSQIPKKKGYRVVSWTNGPAMSFKVSGRLRIAYFEHHPDVSAYIENFIHSTAGELLERDGWFRIHAAGIYEDGRLRIWNAQAGAGKSTRTLRALKETQFLIAGDEIVFFHNGIAYPWPVPIAVKEPKSELVRNFLGSTKSLHLIPSTRVPEPTANFEIYAVSKHASSCIAVPAWFGSLALGLGLPQMKVYLVRWNSAFWLIKQAFRRVRFAWTLWRAGQVRIVSRDDLRKCN